MNMKLLGVVALSACASTVAFAGLSGGLPGNLSPKAATAKVTGDYVEARTESVFCGPCHYNGEAVTVGREALMAWNIDGGSYNGVALKGVRAVAAVTSDENLNEGHAPRKTEVTFDTHVSDPQMAAFTALLHDKLGEKLGPIVAVRRAAVSFSRGNTGYAVSADGFATLNVQYRADDSCCVMPSLVWCDPISPVAGRKVGYTEFAKFTGTVGDQWYRSDEDSAFYGPIAF